MSYDSPQKRRGTPVTSPRNPKTQPGSPRIGALDGPGRSDHYPTATNPPKVDRGRMEAPKQSPRGYTAAPETARGTKNMSAGRVRKITGGN